MTAAEGFAREEAALLVNRVTPTLAVGAGLYATFWLLDLVAAPDHRYAFLIIRSLVVAFSLLTIAAMRTDLGKRQARAISMAMLLAASFGISWMTTYIGGFHSDYYIGNMLVLFYVGLFMPWPLRHVVLFSLLVCAGYFGCNFATSEGSTATITAAFFLMGTSAFTCVSNVANRRSRLSDFNLRMQLEAANRDLKRMDETKTRFFSNVSHELRTPLMLILGPIEQLLSSRENERARPMLQTMAVNADRLLRQVNMLLDFSKLDAGRLRCQPETANLGMIVRRLTDAATPYARVRGIAIEYRASDDIPDSDLDVAHVETIVANLISNALKFTPRGGCVITEVSYDSDFVSVSVKDTGPGISAEQHALIFDRFHQVDDPDHPGGTGLGLALVKELSELHQGGVTVSSEPKKGARFTVALPRAYTAAPERRRTPRRKQDRAARVQMEVMLEQEYDHTQKRGHFAELSGANLSDSSGESLVTMAAPPPDAPRILLAEDNADLRAFTAKLLSEHFIVETACDGEDAWEKIARFRPDAVVSDVMMPKVDGHELSRRMRQDPSTRSLPLVLLTARTGVDATVEGLDSGADDYVTKPFDARELVARLQAQLRARRTELELRERDSRLAAVGQFTTTIAHDIRSPLQAITGHADLAAMMMKKDDGAHEDLVAIKGAATRAMAMMQKIVDFARTSTLQLDLQPLDLCELVRTIERDLRPTFFLAKVGFDVRIDAAVQGRVSADPLALRRVIENLVGNAKDVLLQNQVHAPHVTLSIEDHGEKLRIRVSDNGPGVPDEIAATLFQPFVTAKKAGGSGLGLSISSNLVKAHGGSITVVPSARGAVFQIELPREIPADLVVPAAGLSLQAN